MGEHSQDSDSGFVAFFIERCIVGELIVSKHCPKQQQERDNK